MTRAVHRWRRMQRIKIEEPATFDISYEGTTLRVKVSETGIVIWRRATQGNHDSPRKLDNTVEASWKAIGNAGYCYSGTRSGVKEGKGPALGRGGLHYLVKPK